MDWNNIAERDVFLKRFLGLCELFGVAADEFKTELYFRALSGFSAQEVVRGIDRAVTQCRFFPKPVELLELIQGCPEDIAEVEAGKVVEAVKRVGSWKSVVFDDAVTAAVVEQGFGGWVKLCSDMTARDEKWFRKDFCRLYVSFARQNVRVTGALAGQAAIANNAHCNKYLEPVALVGNAQKAQAIFAAGSKGQGTPIAMLAGNVSKKLAVEALDG
ncbi:DUF6475 domain-containing protein [Halodesulfovibrio marinisediminis]|uniref:DUF6475 domain-containing protein n=1 Tax=Halodesulfovibrio marinisediminis DSM 17456 TaxID=1121457 RepID=A0A1N6I1U3_9BACT|nr:DUF6475 domain-containing protein [Halodesulfovibrio marinisediminis]SIO26006.1 hypothetical protein SAMN02745161_2349 [Halodesulfovibrio marinisediminis DSM 17456]